jgi:hypothetical protein
MDFYPEDGSAESLLDVGNCRLQGAIYVIFIAARKPTKETLF